MGGVVAQWVVYHCMGGEVAQWVGYQCMGDVVAQWVVYHCMGGVVAQWVGYHCMGGVVAQWVGYHCMGDVVANGLVTWTSYLGYKYQGKCQGKYIVWQLPGNMWFCESSPGTSLACTSEVRVLPVVTTCQYVVMATPSGGSLQSMG